MTTPFNEIMRLLEQGKESLSTKDFTDIRRFINAIESKRWNDIALAIKEDKNRKDSARKRVKQ